MRAYVNIMSKNVKIITGSHGSGKSDWIYNRFLDMSRKDNDKSKVDMQKKIYLVVPEQDTNDKQRIIMKKSLEKGYGAGMINIDVVSFDRIAHNVFDILNIEPIKENVIDDDMKTMILTLVLSKLGKAQKLKFCDKMVNRVGFAKKLTQVVSEFYAYDVSDEDIDKVIADKNSDAYRDKLNDFKLIFNEFKKILLDMNFSIKEDKYDLLNKRIKDVDIFNDAIVAFDGFTGFTPIQLSIFKQIVGVAKEVYVSIDYRNPEELLNFDLNKKIDDTDLFYLSKKFIKDIAKSLDIKSINDLLFDDGIKKNVYKYDSDDKSDLRYIEKNIYTLNNNLSNDLPINNIDYYVADNVRDEVRNLVQLIFDLVRNKDYKYNDIRIVVPSIENYRDNIIKTFNKYNIPLFIDDSEGILNSPYIEVIRSAIDVINYNFSYESIMRYINSGISEKDRAVYEFDNFIIEHAIRGYDRYKYGIAKIKMSESTKESVDKVLTEYINPLLILHDEINVNAGTNIQNYILAIRSFVKNAKIDEKFEALENKVDELKSDINSKDSASYNKISAILKYSKEVVDKILLDLSNLEKYKEKDSENYINDNILVEDFRRMFDVGLSSKTLKSIPYLLDQVVVGDIMRSRFDNPKIEVFLGLNQSAIPAKSLDYNLIDDAIRELFTNNVKELSQTTIETALNQRFYIYLILTNPTEKLILSYTKTNFDGESDEKSPVLIMIENLFAYKDKDEKIKSRLIAKRVNEDNFKFYSNSDLISYVASNMQGMKRYAYKDKDGNFEYEFSNEEENRIVKAKEVLKYIKKNEDYDQIRENIFEQSDYYRDVKLNAKINEDLLNVQNKSYSGSATAIENYNKCPFKYFMEHTLELRENKEYNVEAYDIGDLAHVVFKELFKNNNIKNESIDKIHKKVDDILDLKYVSEDKFNEFNENDKNYLGVNKLEYLKDRMREIMHYSTDILIEMSKEMQFETKETEYPFKYDINKNGDKNELLIGGKIDRVDICNIDGKTYVNVVDYKSGKKEKTLDMKEIEAGINVQLTLYIDYCLNEKYANVENPPIFAGSFYFWVDKPRFRYDGLGDSDNNAWKSEMGYSGMANSDREVLNKVYDIGKSTETSSKKIKSLNLKNGYKVSGNYISDEELNSYIEKMHEKINQTVDNINKGIITAKPYKCSLCKYCQYSSICKKDQLLSNDDEDSDAV